MTRNRANAERAVTDLQAEYYRQRDGVNRRADAYGGYTANRAEATVAAGEAELVAFGVPFLANPDLVERVRLGAELNTPDPSTFCRGNDKGHTDYSELAAMSCRRARRRWVAARTE